MPARITGPAQKIARRGEPNGCPGITTLLPQVPLIRAAFLEQKPASLKTTNEVGFWLFPARQRARFSALCVSP